MIYAIISAGFLDIDVFTILIIIFDDGHFAMSLRFDTLPAFS
jgi:hypothetical protein